MSHVADTNVTSHTSRRQRCRCSSSTYCNTQQRNAKYCNILQHTATHYSTLHHTATHCNTLQHTATRCNTLQYTGTHCNTFQHIATYCNKLQHCAANNDTLRHTWQHTANCRSSEQQHLQLNNDAAATQEELLIHCNPLQHTTTHYNTLQHTATHGNTLQHAVGGRGQAQCLNNEVAATHEELLTPVLAARASSPSAVQGSRVVVIFNNERLRRRLRPVFDENSRESNCSPKNELFARKSN